MTTAIAVQKGNVISLASDTLVTYIDYQMPRENLVWNKVINVGNSYIAGSGKCAQQSILRRFIDRLECLPNLEDEFEIATFIEKYYAYLKDSHPNFNGEDGGGGFEWVCQSWLVVNPKGMFCVYGDLSVIKMERFVAIGSGKFFAMGAAQALYDTKLNAKQIAYKSVESAASMCLFTDLPINQVQIKVESK